MKHRRRIACALLIVVGIGLTLAGGRWYVAQQRIERVAAKASIRDARAPQAPAIVKSPSTVRVPGNGEAAAMAAMLVANSELFRERRDAERAALPVLSHAMDASAFSRMLALADDGNARAACVLAVQIAKCTSLPAALEDNSLLRSGAETLRAQGRQPSGELERRLARSNLADSRLRTECAGFDSPAGDEAWMLLLQSALQGHPAAMAMFVSRPEWLFGHVSIDVSAAYLRFGAPMLEALAQQGNLDGVTTAAWGYGDFGYNTLEILGMRLLPQEQARSLMWAYVREGILTRRAAVDPKSSDGQGSPHALVQRVEPLVDDEGRRWARQMADQTLTSFEPRVFQPPPEQPPAYAQEQLWETLDRECRE